MNNINDLLAALAADKQEQPLRLWDGIAHAITFIRSQQTTNVQSSAWMYHSAICASRQFGPERGACDCGVVR